MTAHLVIGLGLLARWASLGSSTSSRVAFAGALSYAGMNAGSESVFGGHPAEQRDELLAFGGVEAHDELGLMLGRRIHDLAEHAAPLAGEVQGADAAVPGDGPPVEQAALLEPVDERDHAAGRDLQHLRQRLL